MLRLARNNCAQKQFVCNTKLPLTSTCWKSNVARTDQTAAEDASAVTTTTSSTASSTTINHPKLVKVPALPFSGSLLPAHSKIPHPYDLASIYQFWLGMREKYGTFYQFGLPGVGVGLSGICHVLHDPHEMAAILRQEGQYPFGAAQFQKSFTRFFQERNISAGAIVQQGAAWKKMRRFIQTDLLSPKAAARYVPGILQGAEVASKGAKHYAEKGELNHYLNLASFDMFSNAMLGTLPKVSDPSSHTDPDEVRFCTAVATALKLNSYMSTRASEGVLNNILGVKTKAYRKFEENWDISQSTAVRKARDLYQRRSSTKGISQEEDNAYANQAFFRQASQDNVELDNPVTMKETEDIIGGLLSAGVDTTGGMLSWKLLHLASSPKSQDKIYHELQPTLSQGKLTRESLVLPYLNSCVRESHRLRNPIVTIPMKVLPEERLVHGQMLPKDSVIIFDGYSTGMQQKHFVEPVNEFHPERFSPEAVQERNTLFKNPFSDGARKCPGSRVASLEAVAFCAQLVLDYKMELPP